MYLTWTVYVWVQPESNRGQPLMPPPFRQIKQPPKPLTKRYLPNPSTRPKESVYIITYFTVHITIKPTPPVNHHHHWFSLYPSNNSTSPHHPPKHASLHTIAHTQHLKPQSSSIHQHPPTPFTKQNHIKLPQPPNPQTYLLLPATYIIPVNPRYFQLSSPPQKKKKKTHIK